MTSLEHYRYIVDTQVSFAYDIITFINMCYTVCRDHAYTCACSTTHHHVDQLDGCGLIAMGLHGNHKPETSQIFLDVKVLDKEKRMMKVHERRNNHKQCLQGTVLINKLMGTHRQIYTKAIGKTT